MTDFIKQQQKLARDKMNIQAYRGQQEYFISEQGLDTLITQIIHNTGEEIARFIEGESAMHVSLSNGVPEGVFILKSRAKQHITNLTGVE